MRYRRNTCQPTVPVGVVAVSCCFSAVHMLAETATVPVPRGVPNYGKAQMDKPRSLVTGNVVEQRVFLYIMPWQTARWRDDDANSLHRVSHPWESESVVFRTTTVNMWQENQSKTTLGSGDGPALAQRRTARERECGRKH